MNGLKIREIRTVVYPVETRIPFRFGIAEMRRMPHLLLRLTLERNGKSATGVAADHLLPKWFTKNPNTSYEEDIAQMQEVIATACRIAEDAPAEATPFQLWWKIYHEQHRQSEAKGWAPLLASFGATFIERGIIDAFCRLEGKPFGALLRENGLGIDLGRIHPELAGRLAPEFLPTAPVTRVTVKHTIGLIDPLTAADLRTGTWPDDGLPVSLEDCIREQGLSYFKIKVKANSAENIGRLKAIADLLERCAPRGYQCTLDGNESFHSLADFRQFWERLLQERELEKLLARIVFVEQPLLRDVTLRDDIRAAFRGCPQAPRLVIDESDATLDSLSLALRQGYEGTTHKNCKGIFKSVANLALLKHREAASGAPYLFSGEDLTNIGPVALLQDLCVVQNLGLTNVERNGHHYFRGLPDFSQPIWQPLLQAHSDLYRELPDGRPVVRIENGLVAGESLLRQGLGLRFEIDPLFT